jgi:hypothetical protein
MRCLNAENHVAQRATATAVGLAQESRIKRFDISHSRALRVNRENCSSLYS